MTKVFQHDVNIMCSVLHFMLNTSPFAAKHLQMAASYLSVTMSRTAPSLEVWLNKRANRPSRSSHTNLCQKCVRAWMCQCGFRFCRKTAYPKKYAVIQKAGRVLADHSATSVQRTRTYPAMRFVEPGCMWQAIRHV